MANRITDRNGINYLIKKPKEGQKCQAKIRGNNGIVGSCIYTNGYFESYEERGNRTIITRWKVDLWLPL